MGGNIQRRLGHAAQIVKCPGHWASLLQQSAEVFSKFGHLEPFVVDGHVAGWAWAQKRFV